MQCVISGKNKLNDIVLLSLSCPFVSLCLHNIPFLIPHSSNFMSCLFTINFNLPSKN